MDNFLTPKLFRGQHEHFLSQVAKLPEPPLSKDAELRARIERGREKIAAAKTSGVDAEKISVALGKVNVLEQERETNLVWVHKQRLYAHVAALVDLIEDIAAPGASAVEVVVPGLLDVAVKFNNEETPF